MNGLFYIEIATSIDALVVLAQPGKVPLDNAPLIGPSRRQAVADRNRRAQG